MTVDGRHDTELHGADDEAGRRHRREKEHPSSHTTTGTRSTVSRGLAESGNRDFHDDSADDGRRGR